MRLPVVHTFPPHLSRCLSFCFGVVVCGGLGLPAQEPLATKLPSVSPRTLSYEIEVALQEDGHTISGHLQVTWRNQTAASTDKLLWHIYNNAWEGPQSKWLTEARLQGDLSVPSEWGHTEIKDVRFLQVSDNDGKILATKAQEIEFEFLPQPGAPSDRTVAVTHLPSPVKPGHSVTVELHFTATMPRAFRRSGWGSDGYLHAAQWFPKLGVFEKLEGKMRWNCPPYHYLTEFYSDYANFDVALTFPADYENHFVASGALPAAGPIRNADGTITYKTQASDVHDFAWTVDPKAEIIERTFHAKDFLDAAEEERVARALGRSVEEVRPTSTKMILLLQPEHHELAERYFDSLGKAIYYFGLWYGSYPYPTISCVDPANDARATGGMEYPRLITGGTRLGKAETTLSPQGVTVHEFGHQFWYGLVGNDEFRHAWLDEGFNTFSTQRVLNKAFPAQLDTYQVLGSEYVGRAPLSIPSYAKGDPRGFLGLERWESPDIEFVPALSVALRQRNPLGRFLAELPPVTYFPEVTHDKVLDERRKFQSKWGQPLRHPTMDLQDSTLRRVNAYYRPAMTLETMARLMGEDSWTRLLRAYHENYRFQHPQPEDFLRTLLEYGSDVTLLGENGSVKVDWADFWKHAYLGNAPMDYAVHHMSNVAITGTGDGSRHFDVSVGITRRTDFAVPVEIRVTWEDGSTSDWVWAGDDWTWSHQWLDVEQPAVKLEIDPQRRLMLDQDWSNNTMSSEQNQDNAWHVAVQAMLWTQQVLQYFGGVG